MLGEARRCGLQDFAQHARLELDQVTIDPGSRPLPVVENHGIVAEFDADLGQNPVGRGLDPKEIFFRQDVVGGDVANDVGTAEPLRAVRAQFAPGNATA